jgi:hypothetical protein
MSVSKAFFDIGHSLKDQSKNRRKNLPEYAARPNDPHFRVAQRNACHYKLPGHNGTQVRMSNLWSTSVRDACPDRRHRTVPEL